MSLPAELYRLILYNLSVTDITSFSHVNRQFHSICNELFWFNIYRRDHPEFLLQYDQSPRLTWKESVLHLPKPLNVIDLIEITFNSNEQPTDRQYREKEYAGPIKLEVIEEIEADCDFRSEFIEIHKPIITKTELLWAIYNYYHQPLTKAELETYFKREVNIDYPVDRCQSIFTGPPYWKLI